MSAIDLFRFNTIRKVSHMTLTYVELFSEPFQEIFINFIITVLDAHYSSTVSTLNY